MTSPVIDEILYLLDDAFESDNWHSLLGNLRGITPEEWDWLPPDGKRSIHALVRHVGRCKVMYENHAFGDATLRWDDPSVSDEVALAAPEPAIAWLQQCQDGLRRRIAGLDETALSQSRLTPWGEPKETRWIIAVMMHHDVYHAGEINHLRALCRRDDDWE